MASRQQPPQIECGHDVVAKAETRIPCRNTRISDQVGMHKVEEPMADKGRDNKPKAGLEADDGGDNKCHHRKGIQAEGLCRSGHRSKQIV